MKMSLTQFGSSLLKGNLVLSCHVSHGLKDDVLSLSTVASGADLFSSCASSKFPSKPESINLCSPNRIYGLDKQGQQPIRVNNLSATNGEVFCSLSFVEIIRIAFQPELKTRLFAVITKFHRSTAHGSCTNHMVPLIMLLYSFQLKLKHSIKSNLGGLESAFSDVGLSFRFKKFSTKLHSIIMYYILGNTNVFTCQDIV